MCLLISGDERMVDEGNELPTLKTLYDELWSDARTMITDMNRSISIYFFTGIITLVFSVIILGTATSQWTRLLVGQADTFTWLYAIAGTLGAVLNVAFGISLLYWYNKLKNRYARLTQLDMALED